QSELLSVTFDVLLGAVIAAPVNVVASEAVIVTTLLVPVTDSHRPSGLPAVTVLPVKLMNLFVPPPETRITGPRLLSRVLLVKFSIDGCPPPPEVKASALALAPDAVTSTLVALMPTPCCEISIPSAPAPEVVMVRSSSIRGCPADETTIPAEFAPSVIILVPNVLGRTVSPALPRSRKPG